MRQIDFGMPYWIIICILQSSLKTALLPPPTSDIFSTNKSTDCAKPPGSKHVIADLLLDEASTKWSADTHKSTNMADSIWYEVKHTLMTSQTWLNCRQIDAENVYYERCKFKLKILSGEISGPVSCINHACPFSEMIEMTCTWYRHWMWRNIQRMTKLAWSLCLLVAEVIPILRSVTHVQAIYV